jgi:putative membrane protein
MNAAKWIGLSAMVFVAHVSACNGDDDDSGGTGGTGGSTARGGSSGKGGSAGRAGNGGSIGQAGTGNVGGTNFGGTGGTARGGTTGAGEAGVPNAGTGDTAARGGSGGTNAAGAAGESAGSGGSAGQNAGAGGEGGAATAMLSDAQILHVAYTANAGEVSEGQVAVTRATATAVQDFAQMMVSDHTAAANAVTSLATSSGIGTVTNDVSVTLSAKSQGELVTLNGVSASQFDMVYMEEQVQDHRDVLELFDGTLIPEAQNADVRTLLESMRATVQSHLSLAEDISESL